jgi:phage-related protein
MSIELPSKTQPVEETPLLLKIIIYPFILIYVLISETWKWAIKQLVRFIDYIIKIYDKIIAGLSVLFRPIKQFINYVFNQLFLLTKWIAMIIYKKLKQLHTIIKQLLSPVLIVLESTFKLVYKFVIKGISVIIKIYDYLVLILRKLLSPFYRLVIVLAKHIKHFLNHLLRWLTDGFKICWHFISYLLTPIKYLIKKVYRHVLVYLIRVLKKLAIFLKESMKDIKKTFASGIESIKTSIKNLYQTKDK